MVVPVIRMYATSVSYHLLVRLFQQATSNSISAWRARRFRRLCANFSRSSPRKKPANSTWLSAAGLTVLFVLDVARDGLMNWRSSDGGSAPDADIRFR